jgi:hypothetical protein
MLDSELPSKRTKGVDEIMLNARWLVIEPDMPPRHVRDQVELFAHCDQKCVAPHKQIR